MTPASPAVVAQLDPAETVGVLCAIRGTVNASVAIPVARRLESLSKTRKQDLLAASEDILVALEALLANFLGLRV
jgi:hypothetical protein